MVRCSLRYRDPVWPSAVASLAESTSNRTTCVGHHSIPIPVTVPRAEDGAGASVAGEEIGMTDAHLSLAEETLRQAGLRITPVRRITLRLIREHPHLDAAELHRLAQREDPRIGLASIYRSLNLFRDLGVIQASDLGEDHRHYEVQTADHIHLICTSCGKVVDLEAPEALRLQAEASGFHVDETRLEILGRCPECCKKEDG